MGRFSNLDFQAQPAPPEAGPAADPWPNADAASCLREADGAFRRGRYAAALELYGRTLRFNRDLPAAWLGQIRVYLATGDREGALTWSARALERLPDHPDLLAARGLALVLSGDPAQGMEFLDGAVETRTPSAWIWLARGEALLATRQPVENAERCFRRASALAPKDPDPDLRAGIAYNRHRRYAEARAALLAAVRTMGDNPLVLAQLGIAHVGLGDDARATGFFRRALAVEPDCAEATDGLRRLATGGPLGRALRRLFRG